MLPSAAPRQNDTIERIFVLVLVLEGVYCGRLLSGEIVGFGRSLLLEIVKWGNSWGVQSVHLSRADKIDVTYSRYFTVNRIKKIP